jgi:small-conductance mechanosensitive channel
VIWIVLLALVTGVHMIDLHNEEFNTVVRRGTHALLVLSITIGAVRLVRELAAGDYRFAGDMRPVPSGLLKTFATVATVLVGVLVMLGTLEINIVPLLGALGVGGLAAGLALQPTLTNLFAGFQIAVSHQFRVGDRVRLASGEEGYIDDIAWRTTTLRTPANHLIVIPNSKFADAIVTNYNLPDSEANITVSVSVAYGSDVRRVEAALRDEAKRMSADLPQLVSDFEPVVRLQAYGDSGLNYVVVLRVPHFDSQFEAWNEVHVRFLERLRAEGIEIPYPSRALYLRGEWPQQAAAGAPAPRGGPHPKAG